MKRLLITRTLPEPVLQAACDAFEVALWPHDEPIGAQLLPWAKGCDGLLVMATDRLDAGTLQQLPPSVRAISTYSVGHDHIDLNAATQCGIPIFNTPDVLSDAVAETALLLILSAARDASAAEATLRSGHWGPWSPTRFLGQQLTGKRLGIYGMGRIGLGIAQRALAFGMLVEYHNRSVHPAASGFAYHATLESLMAHSDVFCVCAPSTPQTRGAINAERLALLPRGAVFVNIARGDLVDEDALIDAITTGHIGGTGLDVYRNEPTIDPRFLQLPRTTLLPHIGSATHEARNGMGRLAVDALKIFLLDGAHPPHCLNPDALAPRVVESTP
ncbi:D-glycerate dehydrogenase [Hydrogenophaga sp.]|uniref:2-hydroxyacid dehydrogenase n=1 Tax=Hydrogenophaga sp. TaxID=1904254 RepID=UPI00271A1EAB|nr:D-glycerate dehydrogenase [Hydrogenophaga sp.]MDO9435695.1 D-glycerate dehydrogenase [Hydrogenophaga sp.]